ncbi:MAG: hypothetical protein O3B24_04265 [Verrucomicrobia bacterium]|nr:hypothetical protein [Verrucomicrobiota bacterium]
MKAPVKGSTIKQSGLAILFSCFLAGCVTPYPMGLTADQWNSLPTEKQAELQSQQYAIDAQARQQREARQMEQQRLAQAQAVAAAESARQAYVNARYGDVVNVVVQGGSLQYSGKRYPYEPVSFDLVKGETKSVAFRGRGMQTVATHYDVRLSEDGNTIYFDDASRQRAVLVNHDWEHGEAYQPAGTMNDVSVGLSGMTMTVKLKGLPGAPQKVIIENR